MEENKYRELKANIRTRLDTAAQDFFMIGYYLRKINDNALFAEDGYKTIWEFAKSEYGLSTSSASRFMAINARFSVDDGEHMAQKYIGMGVSKLQEMLGLPDEALEQITKETTVREIRAMKTQAAKDPLSFYGFPATQRPEGSLIATPGCGEGKYDCFACCRDCAIRQEERYCVTAPMGNPFPCSHMGEDFRKSMEYSFYKKDCQMLHPELAPVRVGDKEPSPCCLNCELQACFLRCDVAKKKDEQDQKDREAAERQRQREAEAAKQEPSEKDIAAFYRWAGFNTQSSIDAESLKKKYRNSGGGGWSDLRDYQCSARGIRINHKRELTYVQMAKRLTEYQEKQRQIEKAARPDIADKMGKIPVAMTDKEKDALLKEKEPDIIEAFYKSLYPGCKETIKGMMHEEITKMLKKEYGESYEGGRDENGLLWNCYPDKINLSISGLGRSLQITWGKFTSKLLALLVERPELTAEPAPEQEQGIQEQAEAAADLCGTCAHEGECAGRKTSDTGCMGYAEAEIVEAPENDEVAYGARDVEERLQYFEGCLRDYKEAKMPIRAIRKQLIVRDALAWLLKKMEKEAAYEEDD